MSEEFTPTLGDRIRAELALRDRTQVWLAQQLGRTNVWVSRRINGQSTLSVDDLLAIAAVLEIEPAALLARREAA